jgi:hypothetical protein
MSKLFASVGVWLLLFVVVTGLNSAAYGFVIGQVVDLETGQLNLGTGWSDSVLLGTCFVSFLLAGFAIALHMRGAALAIPWAMALGSVWVASQIACHFPWYQMWPSHPSLYDRLIALLGALCAPVASTIGAVIYRAWRKREPVANAT